MTEPVDPLGPILFEKRAQAHSVVIWVLASITFGASCFLFPNEPLTKRALGLSAACLAGLVGLNLAVSFFRGHQSGVVRRTLWGKRVLRFDEIQTFAYSAIPRFAHGLYVKTDYQLLLLSSDPAKERHFSYGFSREDRVSLEAGDEGFQRFRDHLSGIFAARLEKDFAAGQPIPWTPHLSLLREGLGYAPPDPAGLKKPAFLLYRDVDHHAIEDGLLRLWSRGDKVPVIEESASQPNFYPGYRLLSTRLGSTPT